jgi:hypothetical protein
MMELATVPIAERTLVELSYALPTSYLAGCFGRRLAFGGLTSNTGRSLDPWLSLFERLTETSFVRNLVVRQVFVCPIQKRSDNSVCIIHAIQLPRLKRSNAWV